MKSIKERFSYDFLRKQSPFLGIIMFNGNTVSTDCPTRGENLHIWDII